MQYHNSSKKRQRLMLINVCNILLAVFEFLRGIITQYILHIVILCPGIGENPFQQYMRDNS